MPKRNPIVGSSMKKRLIHPNLMVWEDTRKAVGGNRIFKIRTKPLDPSGDIKRRVFCHWGTSKRVLWDENTSVRVLNSNGYFYS